MDDSTKKSEDIGSTSSTTAQTTESQEGSWNEKDFWNHYNESKARREAATIQTGEPVPEMVLGENERYEGVDIEMSVKLEGGDGDCLRLDQKDIYIPRYALRDKIHSLCESYRHKLDIDSMISILSDLATHYENKRHC